MTPLVVAWISDFPIEWLPDAPAAVSHLRRQHPAMWEMVLLGEFERNPALQLHIIVLRSGIERSFSFQRNGVTFHIVKYMGGLRAPSFFWVDTLLIRRVLKTIKPHIVHAWGNERGAGLVATRCGRPFLITIQGLFNWYRQHISMSKYDRLSVAAERLSLSGSAHVTAESNFSIEFLRQMNPRLILHQAEHAPSWLFHNIKRQPVTETIRFMTVGTINHRKGSDLLLKALNELVNEIPFQLVIVGDPNASFLDPLKATLSKALWDRIEFKGHLQPAQVASELIAATLMLFPTRVDNSPNAVKEAVVAGVPVVASAIGGIPDYVIPGKNGVLFEPGNLAEFIGAIREACRHPLFRMGQIAPENLSASREYLSPSRMATLFLDAYQKVCANRLK